MITMITATTIHNAITEKRKEMQKMLQWGKLNVDNCWQFKYLGSIYEVGGGEMTDVKKTNCDGKVAIREDETHME